jgi:hypothetical protein
VTTAALPLRLLLAASLVTFDGQARAEPLAPRPRACGAGTLQLSLVNQATVTDESLDVAMREASAIWRAAGLRLRWIPFPVARQVEPGSVVFVVVRPELQLAGGPAGVRSRRRTPLGRVSFSDEGRPANLIEVAASSVRTTVLKGTFGGFPVAGLPLHALGPLVGRGLGRVIAHEVGHWLLGRGHAQEGLMKPSLRSRDLVDAHPPGLPRRWSADGEALPLGTASRCELEPHALSSDIRVADGQSAGGPDRIQRPR